ncbi:hypothetical protein ABTF13_16185 [Acinetobacter baumannii]
MSNNENHHTIMLNSASIIESQFSSLAIFINEAKKTVSNIFTLKVDDQSMLKTIEGFPIKINNISELLQENRKLIILIKESDLFKNIKIDIGLINPNFEDIKSTVNNIYSSIFSGIDYNRMLETMVEEYVNYNNPDNKRSAKKHIEGYQIKLNRLEEDLINLKTLIHEVTLTLNSYQFGYNDHLEKIYLERFKKETTEFTEKIEKTSNKLLSTHGFEVKKLKDDYENILNNFNLLQENFKNSEKHNKELQGKLLDYDQQLNKIITNQYDDVKTILDNKMVELDLTYGAKISYINDSYENTKATQEQFKDIVEKSGIYHLTKNYYLKSKAEKLEYTKFRNFTAYAIIGAIASTLIMFFLSWGEEILTGKDTSNLILIFRLSISLMFFVLAFYLSKQAAKHYECHQENNQTFLQLAALEPFIANMTPEEKKVIRKELVPIYFKQYSEGKFASKESEISLPHDIKTYAEKLIDTVKTLVDKNNDPSKPTS